MNIPADLLYTKEHEWIKVDGTTGTIGISDYAQHALGDVTFVDLPKAETSVIQFKNLASVESVKAASDIFAPLSGKVITTNIALETQPALVNTDPYGNGWIAKITIADPKESKNLLNALDYKTYIKGLDH